MTISDCSTASSNAATAIIVTGDSAKELLRVTYLTGCRPQELVRVAALHFDHDNVRWAFPPDQAKGKRVPRMIYLVDKALEITIRRASEVPEPPIFRHPVEVS